MPVTLAAKYECFKKGDNVLLYDAVRQYCNDSSPSSAVAQKYGHPIGKWCVNELEDFSEIFYNLEDFNENLAYWNTSSATTMSRMFYNADAFNQKLDHFDVSSVFDFTEMFYSAASFDQDISNWNMQSAEYLSGMFSGYTGAWFVEYPNKFRKDLCAWGTYLYNKADIPVESMFHLTDCWNKSDPVLDASPPGPFCYPCKDPPPPPNTPRPTTSRPRTQRPKTTSTPVSTIPTTTSPTTPRPTTPRPTPTPPSCEPVAACVAKVEETCHNKCPELVPTCFTNAVQGCCADHTEPTQAYLEKVRKKYEHMHDCGGNLHLPCDPPPKDPIQACVNQLHNASCPPCNVNTQCFQNVVAHHCCRGNEPEDAFVTKVTSKYQNDDSTCHPQETCYLTANDCVSVVQALCTCSTQQETLDFECMTTTVHNVCCHVRYSSSIKPNNVYVDHVREGYQQTCIKRGKCQNPPPPNPVLDCADKVEQFCGTTACNGKAISQRCLKDTVEQECCWKNENSPLELFVNEVRAKYDEAYCSQDGSNGNNNKNNDWPPLRCTNKKKMPSKPALACAQKIRRHCTDTCRLQEISHCIKDTVDSKCCGKGTKDMFVTRVRAKYAKTYCRAPGNNNNRHRRHGGIFHA